MPYLRFAPQADNRRASQATTPLAFLNCYLERTPLGAAKNSEWFVTSRPGRTRRVTHPSNVRGLFCEPGCRDGHLFSAAGSNLYEVFSNYSASSVGALAGGDVVIMRPYQDDLALKASTSIKIYDGSSLTTVSDIDAPAAPGGLASAALRLVSFEEGAVAFAWSKAGLPLDWPSDGEAATPDLSDPVVAVEEVNDDLWVFGKRKIRPWQATGSAADADAFALIPGAGVKRGLAGVNAITDIGGAKFFIADNRAAYRTVVGGAEPLAYRNMELALAELTTSQLAAVNCWSFEIGAKRFAGVSAGLQSAYVLDLETMLWAEWQRYGVSPCDIDFAANAFGATFVAGASNVYLWTLDSDVFADDTSSLVRQFTFQIMASDAPIDRLVFDIDTHNVPLSGDGSTPVMQVEISRDNGRNWVTLEDVGYLPYTDNPFRPQIWALGIANAVHGLLVRCTISAPFGFAAYGVWVNPAPEEVLMG